MARPMIAKFYKSQITKWDQGQSLFEVVVAIGISALIIVAVVSLTTNAIQNSIFSKNKAQAASYAQEAIEWIRSERDRDIVAFEARVAVPIWCMPGLSWSTAGACLAENTIANTPFIREITFTSQVVSGKTIIGSDVSVSWTDSQGLHKVTSATNLTDWRQR